MAQIKPKDRDVIISALRAGVVPRLGLQHIQVGRKREIEALLGDIDRIASGGAALRFVIGEYGAGKTFFLFLVRQLAIARNLVVMHADLSPDRRLHASGGQARALYAELAKNAAIRSAPEGGALRNILERFVGKAAEDAKKKGTSTEEEIGAKLAELRELAGGYDFASVVGAYARAYEEGSDEKRTAALRWLRGEYSTKTDARQDLGVRTIVDDSNIYDNLKLLSRFVRLAGYGGLFVCVDELVNLYKLQQAQSRNQNFEQILRILNDVLQGSAQGMGFALGGTPEFLFDTRRGLYSYEALQSRLAQNTFATGDLVDYAGPVIRLQNLTPEEMLVLFERLRDVFAGGDPTKRLVPDEALHAFAAHCRQIIGDSYFRTPRTSVKGFVDMLAVLEQNPGADWRNLLGKMQIEPDRGAADELLDVASPGSGPDDELTRLQL
jgi:bacteriophage exclusion system BrxC/D-like protein